MASVAVGRPWVTNTTYIDPQRCPPQGYDSVVAEVRDEPLFRHVRGISRLSYGSPCNCFEGAEVAHDYFALGMVRWSVMDPELVDLRRSGCEIDVSGSRLKGRVTRLIRMSIGKVIALVTKC